MELSDFLDMLSRSKCQWEKPDRQLKMKDSGEKSGLELEGWQSSP